MTRSHLSLLSGCLVLLALSGCPGTEPTEGDGSDQKTNAIEIARCFVFDGGDGDVLGCEFPAITAHPDAFVQVMLQTGSSQGCRAVAQTTASGPEFSDGIAIDLPINQGFMCENLPVQYPLEVQIIFASLFGVPGLNEFGSFEVSSPSQYTEADPFIYEFEGNAPEPADPPVDPTDPPVDPTDPPVDPVDPMEPVDPPVSDNPADMDDTCGSDGQSRCEIDGERLCDSWNRYDSSRSSCRACGYEGETFCRDADGEPLYCAVGHRYDSSRSECRPCGGAGQTFCRDADGEPLYCDAWHRYDSNQSQCRPCGRDGETFCRDADGEPLYCDAGHRYDSSQSQCRSCGAEGQTFCRDADGEPLYCNEWLRYDSSSSQCLPCGAEGELACEHTDGSRYCMDGLENRSNRCRTP